MGFAILNSDGWRIQASRGIIRLTGCFVNGMETIMEYPDIIWVFPPDVQALPMLEAIEIGDYRLSLDHKRVTVHHHGSHDDPMFIITHGSMACAEINLYRPVLAVHDRAVLIFLDGRKQEILVEKPGPSPVDAPTLQTILTGWPDGERRLHIDAPDGAELIWQVAEFGRFHEQRILLSPGRHDVPVPYFFADWLGIVISTRNLDGPVEHKYMASGNLGAASARWLLDVQTGHLLAPPQARHFAFRPLCVYLEGAPTDAMMAIVADFHEVLFCVPVGLTGWRPPDHASWRVVTWADLDDPNMVDADWVRLPPDCRIHDPRLARLRPHQRRSYGLFCDADMPDFSSRLDAALAARAIMAANPEQWLDFAWLSAHHDPDYAHQPGQDFYGQNFYGQNFYGLGYSFPRQSTWYDAAAQHQMRVTEKSRFLRQSSLCYDCAALDVAACRQIMPRPGPLWWPRSPACPGRSGLKLT